jgi:50S ribosomal protein L16 3-hydroxylase
MNLAHKKNSKKHHPMSFKNILAPLCPKTFISDYWQKKSLFVPQAGPDTQDWLTRQKLFELAQLDNVESRLITHQLNGQFTLTVGPFTRQQLARLPKRNWTLLVQGVEQYCPEAHSVLQRFDFISHARRDDLMVSYAVPGGGVGPHFDSYDVFLLQGLGVRNWQLSAQKDLRLVKNAPLRILKHMVSEQQWEAKEGDLLYVPPRYAHHGIAKTECVSLSIGFRIPSHQELGQAFLDSLQDHLALEGMIEDPDLVWQSHPAELPDYLLKKFTKSLNKIRWTDADIRQFTGCYLTEPKTSVVFTPAAQRLGLARLEQKIKKHGIRLALSTKMLLAGNTVFINGEAHRLNAKDRKMVLMLADQRESPPFTPTQATLMLFQKWYRAGYLHL